MSKRTKLYMKGIMLESVCAPILGGLSTFFSSMEDKVLCAADENHKQIAGEDLDRTEVIDVFEEEEEELYYD